MQIAVLAYFWCTSVSQELLQQFAGQNGSLKDEVSVFQARSVLLVETLNTLSDKTTRTLMAFWQVSSRWREYRHVPTLGLLVANMVSMMIAQFC